MTDLSILIPARNEMFLLETIEDILKHSEADTEIIAVLDGQWPVKPIPQNDKVTILYYPESIGQRAATNRAASISKGKYLMKCDAHCSFAQGFDRVLLEDIQDDWTIVPIMRNLHVFDWVCPNKHRRYQGPSGPCKECGEPTEMDIVWIAKKSPQSTAYRFDKTLHFQYWNEFKKRPEGQGNLTETMSLQGSCFMLSREKYFKLNICDETWGSWGNQGTEVALKTWLSGGKVVVDHRTWYAHMFRTQGGDFGFPYPLSGKEVEYARKQSRDAFINGKWDKAIHNLDWLIKKFSPVPDWNPEKGIIYYTAGTHKEEIDNLCKEYLLEAKGDIELTVVSLNKDLDFGDINIRMEGEKGILSMHKQILKGLKSSKADYIFLCEDDVIYHPSHFDFKPKRKDVFYYNTNVWKVRWDDGLFVWTDNLQQLSGLCADKNLLIDYFTKKIKQLEEKGSDRHYEPGTNSNIYGYHRGGKYGNQSWMAEYPNICIRHDSNLTKSKWSPEEFRNPEYAKGWKETYEIPYWGTFSKLLND